MIHKAPIRRVQGGGADDLVSRLIGAGVRRIPNPVVRAIVEELHEEARPAISEDLAKVIGPNSRHGESINRAANVAARVYRKLNGGAA